VFPNSNTNHAKSDEFALIVGT